MGQPMLARGRHFEHAMDAEERAGRKHHPVARLLRVQHMNDGEQADGRRKRLRTVDEGQRDARANQKRHRHPVQGDAGRGLQPRGHHRDGVSQDGDPGNERPRLQFVRAPRR
jgi:hypothetical protein